MVLHGNADQRFSQLNKVQSRVHTAFVSADDGELIALEFAPIFDFDE